MTCDAPRPPLLAALAALLLGACAGLPEYDPLVQGAHVELVLSVDLDHVARQAAAGESVRLWLPAPRDEGAQDLYDTLVASERPWTRTEDAHGNHSLVFDWPAGEPPRGELEVTYLLVRFPVRPGGGGEPVESTGWLLDATDDAGEVREMVRWVEPVEEGLLPSDRVAMSRGKDLVLEPPQAGPPREDAARPYAEAAGRSLTLRWSLRFVRVAYED